MTSIQPINDEDEIIDKLMAAGATDDEIVEILRERKAKRQPSQVASTPAPVQQKPQLSGFTRREALPDFGDLPKGLAQGAVESLKKTGATALDIFRQAQTGVPGTLRSKVEELPAPKTTSEAIGRFAGQVAGEIPLYAATAGVVNPLVRGTAGRLLGPAAARVAARVAPKSEAMREAINVGITSLPQEVISGSIAESLIRPEEFSTWQGALRTGILSSTGTLFNAGFAYRTAIRNAKNLAELKRVQDQLVQLETGLPPDLLKEARQAELEAETFINNQINQPLYSASDLAVLRQGPLQQPSDRLPNALEAAWKRMTQSLDDEIARRTAELQNIKPRGEIDVLAEAAEAGEKVRVDLLDELKKKKKLTKADRQIMEQYGQDPLVLAAIRGTYDRLKQTITPIEQAGKAGQTPTTPFLGNIGETANVLTFDELQRHLDILKMGGVFSDSMNKRFNLVQKKLDAAAATRNKFLDPDEALEISKEMLDMANKLANGFEVIPPGLRLPTLAKPAESALRQVEGWDLPLSSKIGGPTFSQESKAALDDSYKRWVTGSDAPPDVPSPTVAPPEVQAVRAVPYADAVRNVNIDYTPQKTTFWGSVADAILNAPQNFYDRTLGIGKYSQKTRDLLTLLSGVPEYAEQFADREMRVAVRNPDGTLGQRVVQGRPFNKIINDLSGPDEVREFDAYLKARTSIDSKAKNKKFVLDRPIEDFQAIVENAPAKIKGLADEFKIVADALIDDAVAQGRVSAATADAYKQKFYAGLTRVFNKEVRQQTLLTRLGSLRASRSPSQLMRDNIYGMLNKSRRNAALAQLISDYKQDPLKYSGVVEPADVKEGLYNVPGYRELVTELQEQAGMGIKEAEDIAGLMAPGLDRTDGTVVVYEDGVPSYWKVNDDIKSTLEALNPFEIGIFRSFLSALSVPTRRLTSLGLDLSGIGPASDAILTSMAVPKFIPVVDNIRGFLHSAFRTGMYRERVAAGGAYGGRFQAGEELSKLAISAGPVAKTIRKTGEIIGAPLEIMQAIIRPLSDASRMGEYLVRRERLGESAIEAALGSRRTLGDFNRVGTLMRSWSLITEFGNVGIQTTAAAQQALSNATKELAKGNVAPATRLISTVAAGVTIPTIYLWSLAQDDEELNAKRLSDTGYRNWWFRAPFDMKIGDIEVKEGEIVKSPKLGWWAGQLGGSTVEAFLDGFGPEDRKRLADGFIGQVGINLIPLYAQRLAGMATGQRNVNVSTMLGMEESIPITPRGQEGLDPRIQGNERTSPLALAAGQAGMNPFMVDYALETVGGHLFSSIIRNMGDKPVQLEKSDLPVFGRFFVSSKAPTEGSDMFYRDLQDAKNADRSFNKAAQLGKIEEAKSILKENQQLIGMRSMLESFSAEISEQNSLMLTIMNDDSISPEAKRQYINNLRKAQQERFMQYAKLRKQMPKQ